MIPYSRNQRGKRLAQPKQTKRRHPSRGQPVLHIRQNLVLEEHFLYAEESGSVLTENQKHFQSRVFSLS